MKLSVAARITLYCLAGAFLFWALSGFDWRGAAVGQMQTAPEAALVSGEVNAEPAPSDALAPGSAVEPVFAGQVPLAGGGGTLAAPNGAPLLQLQFGKGPLPWELQIKAAASRAPDGTAAAKAILELLAYLPEEALETAVEQAMNRLPDKTWRDVALPFLLNPQAHGRVLSVLFADLMERPDEVSLPSLRQVASVPVHPLGTFALDNLRLLLGEDFKLEAQNWEALLQARKDAGLPPGAPR